MNQMVSAKVLEYRGKTLDFAPEDAAEAKIPAEELHEHLQKPSTARTKRLKDRCR